MPTGERGRGDGAAEAGTSRVGRQEDSPSLAPALVGHIRIVASYDVDVLLDDKPLFSGPGGDALVPAGRHRVTLRRPSVFLAATHTVDVPPAGSVELQVPDLASRQLVTRPLDCEVSVNGRLLGKGDVTVSGVEGTYAAVLRCDTGSPLKSDSTFAREWSPFVSVCRDQRVAYSEYTLRHWALCVAVVWATMPGVAALAGQRAPEPSQRVPVELERAVEVFDSAIRSRQSQSWTMLSRTW